MDTANLTDQQLYQQLRQYRPEIGPVVDSTRKLYTKMLIRARQEHDGNSSLPASLPSHKSNRSQQGFDDGGDDDGNLDEEAKLLEQALDDLDEEECSDDPEYLTESAVEDTSGHSSYNRSFKSTTRIVVEEELVENHFFAKAFLGGLGLVLLFVFTLYLLSGPD